MEESTETAQCTHYTPHKDWLAVSPSLGVEALQFGMFAFEQFDQ